MKNTLDRINSRLGDTEKHKSDLEDRIMNTIQSEEQKEKQMLIKGTLDFPGGPVVKNPPANAVDTGSIPGLGRSHMPRGN